MKTTLTIIILTILAIQGNLLFAGNGSTSAPVANESVKITLMFIVHTTPTEAAFEDVSTEMKSIIDLTFVAPPVADFEDVNDTIMIDSGILAPVTPAEANFE